MKVVTAVVNNPLFIEIQYHMLKKYMPESYEFIVFNDAKPFPDFTNNNDITMQSKIREKCTELGITCIDIPNTSHMSITCAAQRCADAMNFILRYQLEHSDEYLLIDSDMFPVGMIDINKYRKYQAAIVLQERNNESIYYFWNGIYYFNMNTMIDKDLLDWNTKPGCDVGGKMEPWLRRYTSHIPHPNDIRRDAYNPDAGAVYFIRHLWSCSWNESEYPEILQSNTTLLDFMKTDPRNSSGKFFCELYDNVFLHYRAGGNWRNEGMDFHTSLTNKLYSVLLG